MPRPAVTLRLLLALLATALVLAGCGGGEPAPASRGLRVGIQDDRMADPATDPQPRMALAAKLGATLVRVDLRWDLVATRRPAAAADPADPAYDWAHYDAVVDAAGARGVTLLFTIWGTPAWAGDTGTPDEGLPAFGRRPVDPADAGRFAEAAARRYAPRGVHLWEAWNEPNGPLFLRPQAERRNGRWEPVAPRTYAALLTAMHRGIHAADPTAVVAGGVTAPAGDPQLLGANSRIPPGVFWRVLAATDAPMDAVSHHPYPITPPRDTTPPGRSYIDLYNLTDLTDTLAGTRLAKLPMWLTEFGVATRPVTEYRLFTTPQGQVERLRDAFRRVRATPGVTVFVWYLLQDHAAWASGLVDEQGVDKPAAAAYLAEAQRR